MSKRRWYGLVGAAAIAVVASWLVLSFRGEERTPQASAPVALAASAPRGGPDEGIKVHGHWTIEVRNPDGTVATRREFENELNDRSFLPRLLARQFAIAEWKLSIGAARTLDISEHCASPQDPTCALTVSVDLTDANAPSLVLRGTKTSDFDGAIHYVHTISTAGGNLIGAYFTSKELQQDIPFFIGQLVIVTVAISFS